MEVMLGPEKCLVMRVSYSPFWAINKFLEFQGS
jgi:hypothetical protein